MSSIKLNSESVNFKEIIRKEYQKCYSDPVYFMKKYCMIQHPQKGRMLFNLFTFQEDMLRELQQHEYNIVLKSRQLGISTVAAGYGLWLMTFFSDKNILIIATKQDVAKNLVTKVRFMYQNLPSWLKEDFLEDNRLSLKLKNGSQIKATSSTDDAGRSEALSFLIIDECAFINNSIVENIWTSAQQTLATGGGALILSTPNGQGNFFHRTWVSAENGENGFNTIRLPWYVHPERDDSWRLKQDKLLGKKDAAQECLAGHHNVIVKDDVTGEEFRISLQDLYHRVTESNKTYKILSPSGFQKFKTVQKTTKKEYLEITLNNKQLVLTCSKEHRFISNGSEVYAHDLRYKSVLDTQDGGKAIVTRIKEFNSSEIDLYDIIEVENGNLFIVDGIVTHNCVDGSKIITIQDEDNNIRNVSLNDFYLEIYEKHKKL